MSFSVVVGIWYLARLFNRSSKIMYGPLIYLILLFLIVVDKTGHFKTIMFSPFVKLAVIADIGVRNYYCVNHRHKTYK